MFYFLLGDPIQQVDIKSGYFEINCLIENDNSDITWTKNDQPFTPPSDRDVYFTNNKRKIVFERLRAEDSGLYMCVAHNQYLSSGATDLFIEDNMGKPYTCTCI